MRLIPDNVEVCLDIGCGKGELSFMLSQKAKKVIAVDIADKMIENRGKISQQNLRLNHNFAIYFFYRLYYNFIM